MYTISLQFDDIWDSNPQIWPRNLSQVSWHGDVHRHLETRKHETPGGDSGGESDEHVAVPSNFQASDDGFLLISETKSRFI